MASSTLCSECGLTFSNNNYLRTHIEIIHERKRDLECHICNKRFSVKFSLVRHMRQIHLRLTPHTCSFCQRQFSDPTSKMRHERRHTNSRPFECQACLKTFAYANVLKAHLKTHGDNEPKFECALCSRSFTLKGNLESHLKRHLRKQETPKKAAVKKPLGPLFIDTSPPQLLKCVFMPQLPYPHVRILNLPSLCFQNPSKPLRVVVANI